MRECTLIIDFDHSDHMKMVPPSQTFSCPPISYLVTLVRFALIRNKRSIALSGSVVEGAEVLPSIPPKSFGSVTRKRTF